MFDESHAHTVTGVGVFRGPDDTSWATFLAVDDRTLPEVSHEREADSKPEPKPPVFAKDDPCGETVEGSVFGGATVVKFAAADPDRDRVSMTATGLPSWASFTSTSGKKGRGTLRVAPTITHWLNSAFSRPHKAVVTARDVTGEKTRCVFSLRPTLL